MKRIILSIILTAAFFAVLCGIGALFYHFPYICTGILFFSSASLVFYLIFQSMEDINYDDEEEGWW